MRYVQLLALLLCIASPAKAQLIPVSVGITNSVTDVGLLIADRRGYFRAEGLDVSLNVFDSAARMIAPFASGDLDVGSGGASAGLYNAVGRGVKIRIVADKNSTPPGRGTQPLLVRKEHIDSGRFKTIADLKGMRIAISAPGSSSSVTLEKLVRLAGLKSEDVEPVYLGFPNTIMALANKSVDASLLTEPSASAAIQNGSAVKVMRDDEIYPNHQIAVILYSERFARDRVDAARRFMRAYLRAVREYNDALDEEGRLKGAKGEAVIDIMLTAGFIKDRDLFRQLVANPCDPNGTVNVESLKEDLSIFRQQGLIESPVTVEQTIDFSFLAAALAEMGPYVKR